MKILRLLLLCLLPVALCTAASAPTITETLVRIQTDPASSQVQAFFEKTVTVDGVEFRQPWSQVSWAIGADKTVTVAGKTYTYAEVLAAAVAIAQQERAEQAASQ